MVSSRETSAHLCGVHGDEHTYERALHDVSLALQRALQRPLAHELRHDRRRA